MKVTVPFRKTKRKLAEKVEKVRRNVEKNLEKEKSKHFFFSSGRRVGAPVASAWGLLAFERGPLSCSVLKKKCSVLKKKWANFDRLVIGCIDAFLKKLFSFEHISTRSWVCILQIIFSRYKKVKKKLKKIDIFAIFLILGRVFRSNFLFCLWNYRLNERDMGEI